MNPLTLALLAASSIDSRTVLAVAPDGGVAPRRESRSAPFAVGARESRSAAPIVVDARRTTAAGEVVITRGKAPLEPTTRQMRRSAARQAAKRGRR